MSKSILVCGCKGARFCLLCKPDACARDDDIVDLVLSYCANCRRAWEISDDNMCRHSGRCLEFPGVDVIEDFVSSTEEHNIVDSIDHVTWVESQSGRRKQDYGPKVNFKKQKVKTQVFTSLPAFSEALVARMKNTEVLCDFEPVELCNLEYLPHRGAAIAAHKDDSWLWGERLVTINLLSDTKYTMTLDAKQTAANGDSKQTVESDGERTGRTQTIPSQILSSSHNIGCALTDLDIDLTKVAVEISIPARALIVLHGEARHRWLHAIHSRHITERRVGITLRELSDVFRNDGPLAHLGDELLEKAASFDGVSVAEYELQQKCG